MVAVNLAQEIAAYHWLIANIICELTQSYILLSKYIYASKISMSNCQNCQFPLKHKWYIVVKELPLDRADRLPFWLDDSKTKSNKQQLLKNVLLVLSNWVVISNIKLWNTTSFVYMLLKDVAAN